MLWRDFAPYVLPYVVGCPMPTLEHHARLTAIDWCRKTLCLTRDLAAVLTDGTTTAVPITPPTGMQVIRPTAVAVDGIERELVTPRDGQVFTRGNSQYDYCFTDDNATLQVYPLEAAGIEVVITAALMPSMGTSPGLDDDVALEHADDIAKGIVAAIAMLPKQDFTDPSLAAVNQAAYENRRAIIAAKYSRGLASAKLRTPLKTF